MCDCIQETEGQLRDKLAEQEPNDVKRFKPQKAIDLKHIVARHLGIRASSGGSVLSIPFDAEWNMPNGKVKETTIYFTASHCPFCGKEFDQ